MKLSPLAIVCTLIAAGAAAAAGRSWMTSGPGREIEARAEFPAEAIPVFRPALPGELTIFDAEPPPALPGSWPKFRGPEGDGISGEETPLLESWPDGGPTKLWEVELGEGYGGAAIHNGRVYLLDYDEGRVDGEVVAEKRGDVLRCFALEDGRELWRRWYHLPMVRYHGISRTVPAVSDDYVVTLGPMGHVLCVDAKTGEAKWSRDLVAEFGTVIPDWYAGQCPRIDAIRRQGDVAILAPGGDQDVLMLAIKCETGEELWRTPNPRELHMTHSSITFMRINNTRTYVYPFTGGVVGVAQRDGKELWHFPDWQISPAIVPTPVAMGTNRLLFSGGYRAGSLMLEIREDERGHASVVEVARLDLRTLSAEQQTPIFYQDCIYGVLTNNAGPLRGQLACLSSEGVPLWTSGPDRQFDLGPFLVADDKLFLINDDGLMTMIRTSSGGYEELAQAQVLHGHESWGPMAIAGGRMLVRDLTKLVCLDLRANPEEGQ